MASQRQIHEVPAEHLRLLGDMTVTFGLIHFQLMTIAHCVIGLDRPWEQAITAELSLSQLRSITLSVYRKKFGDDTDFHKLKDLVQRSESLEHRRNTITHSLWTIGKDMTQTSRVKITAKQSSGIKHVFEDMTEESLSSEIQKFHELSDDLRNFEIQVCHGLINKPAVFPWA